MAHSSMEMNAEKVGHNMYVVVGGRDGSAAHLMNICSLHFTWIKNGITRDSKTG